MLRSCAHLVILLIFTSPIGAWAQRNMPHLDKAYVHVLQKQYQAAMDITQPLLDGLALNTIEEITLAHKVLGVCQCELKNYPKALEHFQTLKTFTPNESLDGLPVHSICQRIFVTEQLPSQKDKRLRLNTPSLSKTSNANASDLLKNNQYKNQSVPISRYIPFGVGQFKNNDQKKGVAFLIAQSLLYSTATITLSSFASQEDPHRALRDLGIATLISGGFISTWGIVDAVQTYRATQ